MELVTDEEVTAVLRYELGEQDAENFVDAAALLQALHDAGMAVVGASTQHQVHKVKVGKGKKAKEVTLVVNVTAPRGPVGPTGQAGVQGPTGLSGSSITDEHLRSIVRDVVIDMQRPIG